MLSICIFQSTPPARWWPLIFPSSSQDVDFNPHHPQGGDHFSDESKGASIRFQSTPPARWWPRSSIQWYSPEISIHTTRKVVTCFCFYHGNALWFQSTPPARWWPRRQGGSGSDRNFNPHHPQGGDISESVIEAFLIISIHTTRKVVTHELASAQHRYTFQSTPPARWWRIIFSDLPLNFIFQSTPPARWWRHLCRIYPFRP